MYQNSGQVQVSEPLKPEELGLPKGFAIEPTPSGFLTLTTPSGAEVSLTPEEEKAIAKEVLVENMKLQMTGWRRTKEAIITSGMSAAGYAIGVGLGGLLVAGVLRWLGAKDTNVKPGP